MAEHTKTPWRVERGTDLIWGACNPDDMTTYGMGYAIVCGTTSSYTGGKPSIDEREANAAFITKACNSHDALVKALEQARDVLGRIADLSTALRSGGPDPMDLQDLSDALSEATDTAYDCHVSVGEALALASHEHVVEAE